MGAAVTSALGVLLPHPPYFNATGILVIDAVSLVWAAWMFRFAGRIPFWLLRLGPALATVLTSFAVYFSGDSTSGYALFYVWVGLYVFYFPITRARGRAQRSLGVAPNYGSIIAITPTGGRRGRGRRRPPLRDHRRHPVTAASLLTYLRGRMERLMSRLTDAARTDPLTGPAQPRRPPRGSSESSSAPSPIAGTSAS